MQKLGDSAVLQALKQRLQPDKRLIIGKPSCWRKHRHKSLGKANAHVRALTKKSGDATVYAYACRHCGGFHVGHHREGLISS